METKIYNVKSPDGTIIKVKGPVGASQEEVIKQAQALSGNKQQPQAPEINNLAEGARTFAKGATFGFADEIEAKVRTNQSLQDQMTMSMPRAEAYKALKQIPLTGRTPEQQAQAEEYTAIIKNEIKQKKDVQEGKYKSVRDDLRASNAEFARQNPKTAMGLELAGGITTPVLGAAKAATIGGKIARGSLQGAGFGAAYGAGNADEMEDVGRDTLLQGAAGGAIGGVLSGAGAVLAPRLQQGAKAFADKGIPITPGQAFGGVTDTIEQRVGSVMPGINSARTRSIKSWNKSLIDDIIKPLGGKVDDLGDNLLDNVKKGQQVLSKSYDEILPNISMKSDPTLQKSFKKAISNEVLGKESSKKLGKELTKIQGFLKGNQVSGESIKDIQTHLGKRIQAYSGATNADDKAIKNALENSLDSIMDTVRRQNPKYADRLKAINSAYAKFIRVENATSKLNDGQAFTPKQFGSAVRQSDRSARKRAVAAGDALLQSESQQAQILGNSIPDSGTAGNLLVNGLLGMGAVSGSINPAILAIPGVSYLAYSKPGMAAFNKWIKTGSGNMDALRKIIEKYSGTASSGLLTLQD